MKIKKVDRRLGVGYWFEDPSLSPILSSSPQKFAPNTPPTSWGMITSLGPSSPKSRSHLDNQVYLMGVEGCWLLRTWGCETMACETFSTNGNLQTLQRISQSKNLDFLTEWSTSPNILLVKNPLYSAWCRTSFLYVTLGSLPERAITWFGWFILTPTLIMSMRGCADKLHLVLIA